MLLLDFESVCQFLEHQGKRDENKKITLKKLQIRLKGEKVSSHVTVQTEEFPWVVCSDDMGRRKTNTSEDSKIT